MKIINQTYRNVLTDELLNKTPVSELQETKALYEQSLIHIVQHIEGTGTESKYESMKMTIKDFEQKIYEAVQNTFKTRYWDTHGKNSVIHDQDESGLPETLKDASFKEMVKYLGNDAPPEVDALDIDGFVDHVFYDLDVVKRYIVKKNNGIGDHLGKLDEKVIEVDSGFAPYMRFFTTKSNGEVDSTSVNHNATENDKYCQMEIKDGNKISNEWTCPASGQLVVYGWLDSSSALNNKAIPSCYCVLEAKISRVTPVSSDDGTRDVSNDTAEWEIISAQPVFPAKNITYVGFNVPVKEGLVIRARTGFTVGPKSGQYSNENDGFDTLANLTANGFKCMIFSNQEYKTSTEKDTESKQDEEEESEG